MTRARNLQVSMSAKRTPIPPAYFQREATEDGSFITCCHACLFLLQMAYTVRRLRLADTYAEFIEVVERMWAQNPEDRPPFDIILAELADIFDKEISRGNDTPTSPGTSQNTNIGDDETTEEDTESEIEAAGAAAIADKDFSSDSEDLRVIPARQIGFSDLDIIRVFGDSDQAALTPLPRPASQAVITPMSPGESQSVLTPASPGESQSDLPPVAPAESKPPVPHEAHAASEFSGE